MFRFTDWPIRRKLGFLTGVGAAVALLFACAAFTIHDVRMIRAAKVTQITALADILGSNATTALEFDHSETAEEVLSSLRLQPSVEAAALFDTEGKLLASYPADASAEQLPQTCPAAMDANFTEAGYLVIASDIYRNGDHVGTVFLRSNLDEIGTQLASLGWIALAVMTVSLGVSMLITGRLQWLFTAPIHELAEAMERISAGGGSALRVKKHGSDEMGVLCDGFNTMLDRIKFAHDGLRRAHDVLEERVAERTEELQSEITERKQVEEALREAREFLEAAVAQSPSGILIADAPNVTIRLANQAAFGIRGGERRILTGIEVAEHAEKWQTYRPDGSPYPPEQLPLSRAVLQGETVQDEELIIRDEDGNDRWVNASAAPIHDAQGRVTAGIVLFNDITRQKQTEMELARARDSAEAANRSKSEFLANMSHEIRTPMTAILGFSELLLGNVSDPENIDGLKTIQRNGEHLLEIINDILDISKIESGKLKVEKIECSPLEVIADVASLMRLRSSVKGLPLEITYNGPIPQFIQTDPTRLRQILINLIGNAIKFTEVGKIRM
jgi:PAS domain S-box-containing protein